MTTTLAPTRPNDAPTGGAVPPTGWPRYPLGWLRGVAALSVVAFHAYQHNRDPQTWAWPWEGVAHQLMLGTDLFVDMFFVLSGLVLWLPIARSCATGDLGRPGRVLLLRRMARLLPLYYAVVLVVWTLTNPDLPGHWQDLLLHLTFTQVYSDDYIFWTNGPAWSLAVEFHFYVLMALAVPVVNALARRQSTRRARLWVAAALPVLCSVVAVAYLTWATLLVPQDETNWSIWFSPLSRGADFGLGMGLAVVIATGVRLSPRARATLGIGGLAALITLVITRPVPLLIDEWWHPLYAAAVTMALAGFVLHDGPWSRFWDWQPLVRIGALGYGIYLIHEPVMRFMGSHGLLPEARPGAFFLVSAAMIAVPSIALAWVSSRTLEPAGLRMLAMIGKNGRSRDYYEHLAR